MPVQELDRDLISSKSIKTLGHNRGHTHKRKFVFVFPKSEDIAPIARSSRNIYFIVLEENMSGFLVMELCSVHLKIHINLTYFGARTNETQLETTFSPQTNKQASMFGQPSSCDVCAKLCAESLLNITKPRQQAIILYQSVILNVRFVISVGKFSHVIPAFNENIMQTILIGH